MELNVVGVHSFSLPAKILCIQGKLAAFELDGSSSLKPVAATLLIVEKEEAKAVLALFLKRHGLSNTTVAKTISKSDLFLECLVSRLHVLHETCDLTGRELTNMEIREALNPYLEALLLQHGDTFIDMMEHFPHPTPEVKSSLQSTPLKLDLDQKKLPGVVIGSKRPKAMARVSETVPAEELPPHVIYLIELGLDLEKIRVITRKFPSFAYYSLEGKVKPLVEFLLELGVPKSEIPNVLYKRPQLCGVSLSENLIPTMKYLEELGVNKHKWSKLILWFPNLLTYSREKIDSAVSFLKEMGLSKETIGKVITRYPHIVSYSVEDKLRPAVQYFSSMGVDVAVVMQRWPQIFGLSMDGTLRPLIEFFLEKGYSMEEVAAMISKSGSLYTISLSKNLLPKWEFFLYMGYSRSDLVKFPAYFSYSLEGRIKPRYALMELCGVRLMLNQLLPPSDVSLDKTLKAKMKKMEKSNG
ncbi:hypothetical protein Droror1_Dr00000819 [Drosera rotundifolia]